MNSTAERRRRHELRHTLDATQPTDAPRQKTVAVLAMIAVGATLVVAMASISCGSIRGTDRRLLEQNPAPTELAEDAALR